MTGCLLTLTLQVVIGHWQCDEPAGKRTVEYDGAAEAVFSLRRRNKHRRWSLFTRALMDMLFSFIITARTTYTAATRHLSSDVLCFNLRRQDVVKLGTSVLRLSSLLPRRRAAHCAVHALPSS